MAASPDPLIAAWTDFVRATAQGSPTDIISASLGFAADDREIYPTAVSQSFEIYCRTIGSLLCLGQTIAHGFQTEVGLQLFAGRFTQCLELTRASQTATMAIVSALFKTCLSSGTARHEEIDRQTEEAHGSALARQGRTKAREAKKVKYWRAIQKLEDFRAFTKQFLQNIDEKTPKEDVDFLPLENDGNGLDCNELESDKFEVPEAIRVLEELIDRTSRNVRTAPFSKITRRLSFVLLCHGHREYELLHAVFKFPSISTLWRKYQPKIDLMKEQLTNGPEGVQRTIQDFRRHNDLGESIIHANLGVDAFSIIPEKTEKEFKRCCFLFMLQPWDYQLKPIPIHILPYEHSQADQTIQDRIDEILAICFRMNIHVHFLCSDGDQGYSRRHKLFFQGWYRVLSEQGFDHAVAFVSAQRNVPVLDFLHLAKCARSKLVRNPICIDPSSLQSRIDATSMEAILHLGDALTDQSRIGAMRDSYAIRLFTFENALKCLQNGNCFGALYLTLFALCASTLRPAKIPLSQRVFNSKLFFELLHHLFIISRRPHAAGVKSTFRQGATTTTLTTDANWIKLLNTAIGLVCFVTQVGPLGCGDRFGTHCLENFIGLVRRLACGYDSLEVVNRNIAKTAIVRGLMSRLNIGVRHHRRENCGGASFVDGDETSFRPMFAIDDFVMDFLSLGGLMSQFGPIRRVSRLECDVCLRWLQERNEDNQKKPRLGFDEDGKLRNRAASEKIMSMNFMSQRTVHSGDE
jgi:hypothetical protein